MDCDLLTPSEAVRFLRIRGCPRITEASLAVMRSTRGGGPQYRASGRYIQYPESSLREWASRRLSNLLDSTSTPRHPYAVEEIEPAFDSGDLIDYRDPDSYFEEISAALDNQQMVFDYHHELRRATSDQKCPFCTEK